jgi:5,10-methylenetetrahydromethanopterin reductase
MRIGGSPGGTTLEETVGGFKRLESEGYASGWLPNIFSHDAMTTIALAGGITSTIEMGSFVVPTYPRHPTALAQQALSTAAATGGRFILGIGLSHQIVIEGMFGLDFSKPVRHMREYLEVLGPLLRGEAVSYRGEEYTINAQITVPDAEAPQVVVAALGPQMLRVTGRLADGTATWLAGAPYLESTVVPEMSQAAADAGKPQPRVIAGLPIAVTTEPDKAREWVEKNFEGYGDLPSYRRVMDGSNAAGPADVAIVGSEEEVERELRRLKEIGVTDFNGAIAGHDEETRKRTHEFLLAMDKELA